MPLAPQGVKSGAAASVPQKYGWKTKICSTVVLGYPKAISLPQPGKAVRFPRCFYA